MYLFFGFLFALVVALFAVQNSSIVSVRFLAWGMETSLVLVIIGSAALGALSAAVLGLPRTLRLRARLRECEASLRRAEEEARERAVPASATLQSEGVVGHGPTREA
jgi:uncharacterized integral membrane protein